MDEPEMAGLAQAVMAAANAAAQAAQALAEVLERVQGVEQEKGF